MFSPQCGSGFSEKAIRASVFKNPFFKRHLPLLSTYYYNKPAAGQEDRETKHRSLVAETLAATWRLLKS
jgi:hypothetical protein